MSKYISHLEVGQHEADEQKLQSQGFMKSNVNLNKEGGGKSIHLWYKLGCAPITRIQFTFNAQMGVGLINAGYTKIPFPIISAEGAVPMYIWYLQGSGEYDTPIVDIDYTINAEGEAQKLLQGWERLACDLNRKAGGDWLHIWVKREKPTYICDVAATDSFESDEEYFRKGYIRVDEDVHRGSERAYVFFWYRQTTDSKRALSDLKVSITEDEFQVLQWLGYQPVSLNLNKWTGSDPMYLWYKKDKCNNPIKAITLLVNIAAVPAYEKAGVTVVKTNLNTGNKGRVEFLSFYQ